MTPSDIKALMTPDANGLLPCMCGKKSLNIVVDTSNHLFGIVCPNCGITHEHHDSEEGMLEAWNTRAYIPALHELLAVVRKQHEALERAKAKGLSKTAIMRQALRWYQSSMVRMDRGERMRWVDKDGKSTDIISPGCGWEGMS